MKLFSAWCLSILSCLLVGDGNNVAAFTSSLSSPTANGRALPRNPVASSFQALLNSETETMAMTTTTTTTTKSSGSEEKLSAINVVGCSSATVPPMDVMSSFATGSGTDAEYKRGLLTIGFITFIFASNSPVLHAAFSGSDAPPVLLLNAAVSVVALTGLVLGGESLESNTPLPSALAKANDDEDESSSLAFRGGCELGLWKFLGTTANLYGLALTTAGHGALLIQLTTLIVPVVQGIQGVPIPRRIQFSVALALAGVICFTQDSTGSPSATGDALCVVAAIFYATYDLRLFSWGKQVAPRLLITTKIGTQALLSAGLLFAVDWQNSLSYLTSDPDWMAILPVVLWSGVAVNAVAPFLQVGGQQACGPTRCQTIYASQPLWAAIMSFFFLGEMIGIKGAIGGTAFLSALFLAATAEPPDGDCPETNCEV